MKVPSKFTWNTKRRGQSMVAKRLDNFLGSDSLTNKVSLEHEKSSNTPFRFEKNVHDPYKP